MHLPLRLVVCVTAVDAAPTVEDELRPLRRHDRRGPRPPLRRLGRTDTAGSTTSSRDYPSRGGKAIRPALCLATCVAFGGTRRRSAAVGGRDRADAQRLPRARRHRGRQRAPARPADAARSARGCPWPSTPATPSWSTPPVPLRANRKLLGGRMASDVSRRVRADGAPHRRRPGHRARLAPRQRRRPDAPTTTSTSSCARRAGTRRSTRCGSARSSARGGRADLERMVRFGFYLGAAFQIQDDLLNLEGDEDAYGKERCGDLYEGKRTLMLIHVLPVGLGGGAPGGARASSRGRSRRTVGRRRRRTARPDGAPRQPRLRPGIRRRHRRRRRRGVRGRLRRARPTAPSGASSTT